MALLEDFSAPVKLDYPYSTSELALLMQCSGNDFIRWDAGQMLLDSHGDLNFKFFGDTVHLAANAFFHRINPGFYDRHYHSRHFWWDNDDMSKMIHSRIEGIFSYDKRNIH